MSDVDLIKTLGRKWREMPETDEMDDRKLCLKVALDVLLQEYHGANNQEWKANRRQIIEQRRRLSVDKN